MATSKQKKQKTLNTVQKTLRALFYFTFGLLVNIFIVYAFIHVFSVAFNFSYEVFSDSAKSPGSLKYETVEILPDSTTTDICNSMDEAGVIKNKYVMLAKIKIGGYGSEIDSGKYSLSPSMTYDEILNIICHLDEPEDDK